MWLAASCIGVCQGPAAWIFLHIRREGKGMIIELAVLAKDCLIDHTCS